MNDNTPAPEAPAQDAPASVDVSRAKAWNRSAPGAPEGTVPTFNTADDLASLFGTTPPSQERPKGSTDASPLLGVPDAVINKRNNPLYDPPAQAPPQEAAPAAQEGAQEAAGDAPAEETPAEPDASGVALTAFVSEMRRHLPGVTFPDDPAAVPEALGQLAEQARGVEDFRALAGEVPELATFLTAISQGAAPRIAAIEAFKALAPPEPEDDPVAYGEWMKRQGVLETQRATEAKEAEKERQRVARLQRSQSEHFAAFENERKGDPEWNKEGFVRFSQRLLYGLDTGEWSPDAFPALYRAQNHDRLVAEAEKKGYEKALAEVRAGVVPGVQPAQPAGTVPQRLDGGGGAATPPLDPSTLSPSDRLALQMAQAVGGRDTWGRRVDYTDPRNVLNKPTPQA